MSEIERMIGQRLDGIARQLQDALSSLESRLEVLEAGGGGGSPAGKPGAPSAPSDTRSDESKQLWLRWLREAEMPEVRAALKRLPCAFCTHGSFLRTGRLMGDGERQEAVYCSAMHRPIPMWKDETPIQCGLREPDNLTLTESQTPIGG